MPRTTNHNARSKNTSRTRCNLAHNTQTGIERPDKEAFKITTTKHHNFVPSRTEQNLSHKWLVLKALPPVPAGRPAKCLGALATIAGSPN